MLGGCSLFIVLFKTVCADWNCSLVWNCQCKVLSTDKQVLVLRPPNWDRVAFPKKEGVVVVNSKVKGYASGGKMALCFKCNSSLCPVNGIQKVEFMLRRK